MEGSYQPTIYLSSVPYGYNQRYAAAAQLKRAMLTK